MEDALKYEEYTHKPVRARLTKTNWYKKFKIFHNPFFLSLKKC